MAEQSIKSEIWKVLSRVWEKSSLPSNEMAVTLAALIYLRWADFQEAEQEAIAAFDDTDYQPILPSSLHWRSWHLLPPHDLQGLFTKHLPDALQKLNNSRHISLATHLHRIATAVKNIGRLSSQALGSLIHWLADQPFETPRDRRMLLDGFDAVLDKSRDKHSGQFRTPAAITQLLVSLAAPAAGERVYDPCFGSAGLLTAAFDHARDRATEQFSRSGSPALSISGVEINLEAYIIGLVRLTLAGVDDPQLELGNSLERVPSNTPQRDGFDLVLADPPWGMRADPVGLDHFAVRTTDATGLFIQHAMAQLRGNGRAVIVVPQGVLFRGGPEQRLRRMLLEQHTVEAVVSLPHGIFLPYAGIQASVLVLRKSGPTKSIRMIDAESFFSRSIRDRLLTISENQLEAFTREFRNQGPGDHCWDVDATTLPDVEWDLIPRRREQSGLGSILNELSGQVEIIPLRLCCQVSIGRPVPNTQLLDSPPFSVNFPLQQIPSSSSDKVSEHDLFDTSLIPYIRINDLQKGYASKASAWLSPDVANSVDPRWKLKAGDVLLTRSGMIAKAGIVRNGAIGAVAAGGLFVLRPEKDRLDPHFLLAYLQSKQVRAWFADRAHGAAARNFINTRPVLSLPVPIPPLQVQQRVAAEHRENGADALIFLAQLLTEGVEDPVAVWIDRAIANWSSDDDAAEKPLDFSPLESLAENVSEIRSRLVRQSDSKNELAKWLVAFDEALSGIRGVVHVPRGTGLLSVLQETVRALERTLLLAEGSLPSQAAARDLTQRTTARVENACTVLFGTVAVAITAESEILPVGQFIDVQLEVQNQGSLPLRNFLLQTRPDWGCGIIAYLAEGSSSAVRIAGPAPDQPGILTLSVSWSATALNGKTVEGTREIVLEFAQETSKSALPETGIGASPYVCGDPVRPERSDVFFGREELLEQIRRQIVLSGNVVLLEGNRRSGKSSVLWHLEGVDSVPGWLGVYCSLQGAEGSREGVGVPTADVFRAMANSIAKGLAALGETTPLPDGTALLPGKKLGIAAACRAGIGEASPFSDFRDYLDVALDMLAGRQLGLLLMLDEFDKLQEGIDSGVTSPQVPENIRFLVQTDPRFCAILTGSRRLKRLREEHWSALYGLGTRFGVTSLPVEPARRLVAEPVKGRLIYSPEAVERSIFLTSGQPYLLQCLCNRVFDMAAQLKIRSVTLDLVDRAGDALVQDNEHFASLWDYAGSDRRRFLLTLCHKESGSPDALRLGVMQERLLVYGIEIDDETLIADLEYLRELELVELVGEPGGGHYALAIPLMGTWIEKQQDFAAIKRKAKLETEDQHE